MANDAIALETPDLHALALATALVDARLVVPRQIGVSGSGVMSEAARTLNRWCSSRLTTSTKGGAALPNQITRPRVPASRPRDGSR